MTTASITDIKTALQSAIEESTFALPVQVALADSDVSSQPGISDPVQVQIAYKGAGELARTSSRVLEQALVDVNLIYRHPDSRQSRLDDCHLVSQQMRDLLSSFHSDSARVEQLICPDPFNQTQAVQGSFNYTLTLDLDVVRSIAEVQAPEITDTGDSTPLLTQARQAVWNAIENWPAFVGDTPAWKRRFKESADVEELALHDPCAADLPAIAVTWGPTTTEWWTHVQQQWHQQLLVTFWLPANWEAVAEWRLVQLMQAVYQSAPVETPTVSYVRAAVGRPPSKNSPLSLDLVSLGRSQQLKAWRGTIALTLTSNIDPNA